MTATITTLRTRQTLATLCEPDPKADASLKRIVAAYEDEPSRADDERLLRAMAEAEDLGLVVFEFDFLGESLEAGDAGSREGQGLIDMGLVSSPAPSFVSPFLLKPLRSEQEVRAARGKAHPIFETLLTPWRP